LLDVFLFLLGIFFLFQSTKWFLYATQLITNYFNCSSWLIGLFVVGFGSSIPEIVVSLYSVFTNHSSIIIPNVVGSNIINILLGLGISLFFIKNKKNRIFNPLHYSNIIIFILSILLLIIGIIMNNFHSWYSILILVLGIINIYWIFVKSIPIKKKYNIQKKIPFFSLYYSIVLLIMSLIILIFSSHFIINSIFNLSKIMGIKSEALIMTTASLGTSLPEISISIFSARKGNIELIFSNILGSNITNFFLCIGLPSIFYTLTSNHNNDYFEIIWLFISGISYLLTYILTLYKKFFLNRIIGIFLFLGFICFSIQCFSLIT